MKETISGRVTVGGDPAKDAVVELHNATGDIVTQSQVDQDGRYRFNVSPGTWSLRSWDPRGHRGRAEVTLAEGDDKGVDLELAQEGG